MTQKCDILPSHDLEIWRSHQLKKFNQINNIVSLCLCLCVIEFITERWRKTNNGNRENISVERWSNCRLHQVFALDCIECTDNSYVMKSQSLRISFCSLFTIEARAKNQIHWNLTSNCYRNHSPHVQNQILQGQRSRSFAISNSGLFIITTVGWML